MSLVILLQDDQRLVGRGIKNMSNLNKIKGSAKLIILFGGAVLLALLAFIFFYKSDLAEISRGPGPSFPGPLPSPIFEEAVAADHLDVSDCVLKPSALKVKIGSPIKVVNDSSIPVSIVLTAFKPFQEYKIEAKSTEEITLSFNNMPGRYSYLCLKSGYTESVEGIFEAEL